MSSSSRIELLKAALAEYYPLGCVYSLTPLPPERPAMQPNKKEHSLLLVQSAGGIFCLKRHRPEKTLSRLAFEEEFQDRIFSCHRQLVPQLVATVCGKRHFVLNGERWRLERYIAAPHYCWWQRQWPASLCAVAARALFQFHAASAALVPVYLKEWQCDGAGMMRTDLLNSMRPLGVNVLSLCGSSLNRARFAASGYAGSLKREILTLLEQCQQLLAGSEATIEALSVRDNLALARGSPQFVLVHGDYHPGNVLFDGQARCAIVDFEHVHIEHRLFDMAYAVIMFSLPWMNATEPADEMKGAIDRSSFLLDTFLHIVLYTEARVLSKASCRSSWAAIRRSPVCF